MPTPITHAFTAEQSQTLSFLRLLLLAPSAIVAGGWVRDVLAGHEPRDVDVFVASAEIEDTLADLRRDPTLTVTELLQDTLGDTEASSGEHVESVWSVEGLASLGYPLQIIEVASPLAWVPLFDAHCNMLFVPLAGRPFEVLTCSPFAVAHAKLRVWEVNPSAQESAAVLDRRAEKFEARGFHVRRTPIVRRGFLEFDGHTHDFEAEHGSVE